MKRVFHTISVVVKKALTLFFLLNFVFSPTFENILLSSQISAPLAARIAEAAFNQQINYQGKLTDTSNVSVSNGSYNIEFNLYTSLTGGSPIWTETWCKGTSCSGTGTDNRITVTSGLFSTMLGSTTALTNVDFNQPLYLSINIGGSGNTPTWDGEMSPRKILGAVPAAFEAKRLNGLNDTQFLRTDTSNSTSTASTFITLTQSGAGNILNLVGQSSASVFTALSSGNIGIGTTSPGQKLSVAGDILGNNIIGSYFTATSTTATSTFAGTFGIGTSSPSARFSLTAVGTSDTGRAFAIANSSNAEKLYVTDSGKTRFSNFVAINADPSTNNGTGPTLYVKQTSGSTGFPFQVVNTSDTALFSVDTSGNTLAAGSVTASASGFISSSAGGPAFMRLQHLSGNIFEVRGGSTYFSIYDGTASAERLVIDNSGLVGIGTTTPTAKLAVTGSGTGTGRAFTVADSANADKFTVLDNGNTTIAGNVTLTSGNITSTAGMNLVMGTNSNMTFNGNGATIMSLTAASGNVGIGTTSPGQKLSVAGDILGNAIIGSYFTATSSTATSTLAGGLAIETSGLVYDYSTNNVGIGTASPVEKLQIDNGKLKFNNTSNGNEFLFDSSAGNAVGDFDIWHAESSDKTLGLFGNGSAAFNLKLADGVLQVAGTGSSYFTGNLGVGSTSPSARLAVRGAASGADITFQTTNSSDTPLFTVLDNGTVSLGNPTLGGSVGHGFQYINRTNNYSETILHSQGVYLGSYANTQAYPQSGTAATYPTYSAGLISNVDLVLGAGAVERVRVNTDGYVGIGTSSPLARLDVAGANNATAPLFQLSSVASFATTTRLVVTNAGNVGIGTTSPATTLSVAGSGYFTSGIGVGKVNTTANTVDVASGGSYKINGSRLIAASTTLNNLVVGDGAPTLYTTMTGQNNVAVGVNALNAQTTGSGNNALGRDALLSNTTGEYNNAFGYNALRASVSGSGGSAFGSNALAVTTVGGNSAFGYYALSLNTTGVNDAFGNAALQNNTTGTSNASFGYQSMNANITGNQNVAVGNLALANNGSATSTVAVGFEAGKGASGAYSQNNVFLGYQAGVANTTGNNNILLGYKAGDALTSGSNNIVIGYDVDTPSVSSANTLNIGNLLFGTGIDGTGTTLSSGNIGIGTTSPGQKLSVAGDILGNNIIGSYFTATSTTASTFVGNVGLGLTTPQTPLDIKVSSGTGVYNDSALRIGDGSNFAAPRSLLLGVNTTGNGYSYLQSVYAGAATYTPLALQPLGGTVSINTTATSTPVSLASGGDVLVQGTPYGQMGRVGFNASGYGTVGGFPAYIGGYADSGAWSAGVALTFNTIAGADVSGLSGLERMRITSAGNVGIGTTSPGQKLSVAGDILGNNIIGSYFTATTTNATSTFSGLSATNISSNSFITTNGTFQFTSPYAANLNVTTQQSAQNAILSATASNGKIFSFISNDSLATISTQPGVPLVLNTAGSERIRIDTAGLVGIGTTSPGQKLSVAGDILGNNIIGAYFTATTSTATSTFTGGLAVASSTFNILNHNGYVGIGTTSPTSKLVITGNVGGNGAVQSVIENTNTNGRAVFVAQNDGGNTAGFETIGTASVGLNLSNAAVFYGGGTSKFVLMPDGAVASGGTAPIVFRLGGYASTEDRIIFTSTGSIGVGTTSPGQMLSVAGDILGNNIIGSYFTGTSTTASTFTGPVDTSGTTGGYRIDGTLILQASSTRSSVLVGIQAGNAMTTGTENVAIGGQALYSNTIGSYNTAGGHQALRSMLSGSENTAFGRAALYSNSSGSYNTAVGSGALNANTGTTNTGVGWGVLSAAGAGGQNTAIGALALGANLGGQNNNAFGYQTLDANTSGSNNSGFGQATLTTNTIGDNNAAYGTAGMALNLSGSENTAIGGYGTLYTNSTGNQNSAVGTYALYYNTSSNNTAMGYYSGFNSTGANNLFLGYKAGEGNTTGASNIVIGYDIDPVSVTGSSQLNIGNLIYGTGLATGATVSTGNIGIGTTSPASKLHVYGSGIDTEIRVDANAANQAQIVLAKDNVAKWYMYSPGNSNDLRFYASSDVLTIQNTGNVGIGSTSPATTLSVAGSGYFTGGVGIGKVQTTAGYIDVPATGGYAYNGIDIGVKASSTNLGFFVGPSAGSTINTTMSGLYNTGFGRNAMQNNTTGTYNTAIGYYAMNANTTGGGYNSGNTALGTYTMQANTTGSLNTGLGSRALLSNTTGDYNTGVGTNALAGITGSDADHNTAVGQGAFGGGNGSNNAVLGSSAMSSIGNATNTVAIGASAGAGNGAWSYTDNVFIGTQSGYQTSGSYNTFVGSQTTNGNARTGSRNILLGYGADTVLSNDSYYMNLGNIIYGTSTTNAAITQIGIGTTTPSARFAVTGLGTGTGRAFAVANSSNAEKFTILDNGSVGIGSTSPSTTLGVVGSAYITTGLGVGKVNTTANTIDVATLAGSYGAYRINGVNIAIASTTNNNYFFGGSAGNSTTINTTMTGILNTGVGVAALNSLTTGTQNTAVGYSQVALSTGDYNASLGASSLRDLSTGSNNTAIGANALVIATSSSYNTAVGYLAMGNAQYSGSRNIAIGPGTLYSNTLGNDNLAIGGTLNGSAALTGNTTGSGNVAVGGAASGLGLAYGALRTNTTGSLNTALGVSALAYSSTGSNNTVLGAVAGTTIGTGSNNTLLGYGADVVLANDSYYMNLGGVIFATSTNFTNTTNNFVGIGTTTPSARLSVKGTGTGTGRLFALADSGNAEKFTVLDNGNVGIGTTTPTSALTVHGNVRFNNTGDASDYFSVSSISSDGRMAFNQVNDAGAVKQIFAARASNDCIVFGSDTTTLGEPRCGGLEGAMVQSQGALATRGINIGGLPGAGTHKTLSIGTPYSNAYSASSSMSMIDIYTQSWIANASSGQRPGIHFAALSYAFGVGDGLSGGTGDGYSTRAMTIASSTEVGIGTTSPWGKLSVTQTGTSGAPSFIVEDSASPDSTPFIIDQTGSVGIGTVSPANTSTNSKLDLYRASSVALGFKSDVGGDWRLGSNEFNNGDFAISSAAVGGSTYTGRLVLNTAGNVGIGTTSPYAALSVVGSTGVVAQMYTATSTIATSTFAGGLDVGSGALVYDFSSGITSISNLELGAMNFDTNAGSVSWADMPVTSDASGGTVESYSAQVDGTAILTVYSESDGAGSIQYPRVGINKTAPTAALDVTGDIIASGTLTLNGVAGGTGTALCISTGVVYDAGGDTCSVSSARFKHDIESLGTESGLSLVRQLRPVSFSLNSDNTARVGFIAEEVNLLDSRLVFTEPASTTPRGVRYQEMTAILAKAVQELATTTAFISSNYASTTPLLAVAEDGKIGIGTTTPLYALHVVGDIGATSFVNISTREAKRDISYLNASDGEAILEKLKGMKVATYHYLNETSVNPLRLGFIAEEAPIEVLSATGKGVDVYKLATFILAGVQTQQVKIESLEARVAQLEANGVSSGSGDSGVSVATVISSLEQLGSTFGSALAQFKKAIAESLTVGSATKPSGITLYDEVTKAPYCLKMVNGAMVSAAGECAAVAAEPAPTSPTEPVSGDTTPAAPSEGGETVSADTQPPTITVNGNNPATVEKNASYLDLGATVTDNVSQNIGYQTVGDQIDTSVPGTYAVTYSATDAAGNNATATRTVVVTDPAAVVVPPAEPAPTPAPEPASTPAPAPAEEPAPSGN